MMGVVEKTSHPNVELMIENEILDSLISALLWWDSSICWIFDEAWVMQGHDIPECNESTIIATFEGC